jgi:hypothetical protein
MQDWVWIFLSSTEIAGPSCQSDLYTAAAAS